MPAIGYKPYDIQVLYQGYWQYPSLPDGFVTDFIVKKIALAQFAESEYSYTLIGSFDECMEVGDYFRKYYPKQPLPFSLQKLSLSEGYWRGNDIMSTFRFVEKGKEMLMFYDFVTI